MISIIFFGASCKNETLKKSTTQESKKQENTVELKENKTKNDDNLSLSDIEKDTVLSYHTYNKIDETDCKNWINTPKNVLDFVNRLHEISGYEWNQCYGTFECGVKGEVVLKGILYEYNLNAGGWMHLNSEKQEMYLGAKSITDASEFISIYYCDGTWD